jgi:hypothetical protein
LAELNVEQGGDSPLNFFAEPEDQGFIEDLLEDDEDAALAFFDSDQAPLEDEFTEIFADVGNDDGLATLDAHEVVTRIRLTFLLLTLLAAAVLAFLVRGAARLLAPAAVATATTFPFAILALLLYLVFRPDEEVSLGSLIEILDISIGDILRDYAISFGLSVVALVAGLIWSVAAAEAPRRYFERAFPARGAGPPDDSPSSRTH